MASYFISHSSVHKAFCVDLANEITRLGQVAWLDAFDIGGGASIPKSIVDGIYGSDYFVLVMTPEVHSSVWVPWEIELATYREVQVLRRTFVVPGVRVQSPPVAMIAHKNHLDFAGSAAASATALLAAIPPLPTAPQPAPALAEGSHMLMFEMTLPSPGAFSLRKMGDSFWNSLTIDGNGFSYFPLCRKGQAVSLGTNELVIQLGEEPRRASTVLSNTGSVRVVERHQGPVNAADLVRKIGRFLALSYDIASKLQVGSFQMAVCVPGTDRKFPFSYHPADLVTPMAKAEFELPSGHPLNAQIGPLPVVPVEAAQIVRVSKEMQADLFYPLRGQAMTTLRSEENVRYRDDVVERLVREALGNDWY